MDTYGIATVLFLILLIVIELLLYALRKSWDFRRAGAISRRLKEHSAPSGWCEDSGEILKKRVLSSIPLVNRVLLKINLIKGLENLIRQAQGGYPPGVFLILSMLLGILGFFLCRILFAGQDLSLLAGAAGMLMPFFYLNIKKSARMKKFEAQLPEALDLIARSLKAGHAFSSGLKLAADNFSDPLGTEFKETINEINFGLSMSEALQHLGERVSSEDLRFFVISAILQRDTGGNMAEITENIAAIIRQRFKFKDKVRVMAAEGKISAAILIALPFLLFFAIAKLSPSYIEVLLNDPAGKLAMVAAGAMMLCGIVTILKMIKINV